MINNYQEERGNVEVVKHQIGLITNTQYHRAKHCYHIKIYNHQCFMDVILI